MTDRIDMETASVLLVGKLVKQQIALPKNRSKGVTTESALELLTLAINEIGEARDAIKENAPTDDILAELGDAAAYIAFAMRKVESRRNR